MTRTALVLRLLFTQIHHPVVAYAVAEVSQKHNEGGFEGELPKGHACFFWGKIAFAAIATLAGGDQVVPRGFATPAFGKHVVQRKVFGRIAVLALVVIPLKHIVAIKHYPAIAERACNIAVQADNRGQRKLAGNGAQAGSLIARNHFGFVHENKQKCLGHTANGECGEILV